MKRFAYFLAMAAPVGLAVLIFLYSRRTAEARALRERVARLEVELADAKKTTIRPLTETRVGPPSSGTKPNPPPRTTPEVVTADTRNHSEEEKLIDTLNSRRLLRMAARQLGEGIERLGLDPAMRAKVLALFAESYQVQTDTAAAARKSGITDPAKVRQLAVQEVAKVDEEMKRELGPELFQSLLNEADINQEKRLIEATFSAELAVSGDRLTPEQSYALGRAVWENKESLRVGSYGSPELAEAAHLEATAKILTPAQFEAYRTSRQDDVQLAALNRKLRDGK